jgi:enoyl-CoA hydratase
MSGNDLVKCVLEEGVATITINNPPMNPLNAGVLAALKNRLAGLVAEDSLRAVILTGEGKAFVAGADIRELAEWTPDQAEDLTAKGQRLFVDVENFPAPIIAAVNGYALGGGLELALACDIRIASAKAKAGLPEVSLGIIPGYGGSQRICRAIGIGKAKRLLYTGEIIDAAEAERIGLFDAVVEPEKLLPAAGELAGKIAANAPLAVRGVKHSVNVGRELTLEHGLAVELRVSRACFASGDRTEGMAAFLEKRKAAFKNK